MDDICSIEYTYMGKNIFFYSSFTIYSDAYCNVLLWKVRLLDNKICQRTNPIAVNLFYCFAFVRCFSTCIYVRDRILFTWAIDKASSTLYFISYSIYFNFKSCQGNYMLFIQHMASRWFQLDKRRKSASSLGIK